MIPVCDALGVPASRDNCVATFIQRVWDKLHICLCMSPVGDALRVRCRQFPQLLHVELLHAHRLEVWRSRVSRHRTRSRRRPSSPQAGRKVHYLRTNFWLPSSSAPKSDEKEEVCRTAVAKICVKVHTSINETGDRFYNELRRKTYTTPKSYLDLIGMYSSKLGELQGLVDIKIEQMEVGCAKLAETNDEFTERRSERCSSRRPRTPRSCSSRSPSTRPRCVPCP